MDFDYAEGWRPEPGDVIVGTVQALDTGYNDYGSYPIVTVKPESGDPVAVHCFHTSLRNKLTELKPTLGERIGIKYVEKRRTKDGKREVAVYNVRMDRPAADFWGGPQERIPATDVPADANSFQARANVPVAPDDDIPF